MDLINRVDEWDKKVILKYNGIGGKPFTYFLKFVSFFGRETIWLALMAFFLFVWYDPFLLSYITITFLIGLLIIAPIKKTNQKGNCNI